jgi:hypothetical protein
VDNLTATQVPVEAEGERLSSKSAAMSMEWRMESRAGWEVVVGSLWGCSTE